MATKLGIYNLALGHLRETALASLTENREARRHLDAVYDQVVAECLAEGYWNHAMRAVRMDKSATITPAFGFTYAFEVPTDWVKTYIVSGDASLSRWIEPFNDEAGVWWANVTPLFARFVSNDTGYGMNLARWGANYTAWVGFKLAEYACGRITGKTDLLEGADGIVRRGNKAKLKAKSTDAMNEPPGRKPVGNWARSRWGGGYGLPLPGGDLFDD